MNQFMKNIHQLVIANRKMWVNEVVYGYRILNKDLWKYYGYHSPNEMKSDLE